MLQDVLKRVASDTGYHEVNQRAVLVALMQQAADKLYALLECNAIYREVTMVVRPDAVVALPSFIGELRGIRPQSYDVPMDIKSQVPRYVTDTQQYKTKNWRELGDSPVHTDLEFATRIIVANSIPGDIVVKISGQITGAARYEESVAVYDYKYSTAQFGPQIFKLYSDSDRVGDVYFYNEANEELAILYNTDKQTRYKLVDVSQYYWPSETSDGDCLVDVLYKVPKSQLTKDSDSFYAGDNYDDAWYHMAMHCYFNPLENRKEEAKDHRAYALAACQANKESAEGTQEKCISFGSNKFYNLIRRAPKSYPASLDKVP